MTDLSVSIVNTGSRELLLACLETLRGAGADIVVLDNASEDGSAEAVHERFPEVRVIAQERRAGFGANHNTVIRATGRKVGHRQCIQDCRVFMLRQIGGLRCETHSFIRPETALSDREHDL